MQRPPTRFERLLVEGVEMLNRMFLLVAVASVVSFVAARPVLSAPEDAVGSPFVRPAVVGAPFSADATTTVKQTLNDGTRIDQRARARYYRDSAGRVRVERVVPNTDGHGPDAHHTLVMIAPDPHRSNLYSLDPLTRTVVRQSLTAVARHFNGRSTFSLPLAWNRHDQGVTGDRFLLFHPQDWRTKDYTTPVRYTMREEALGDRDIAGVKAAGSRITMTIPAGENDNPRTIDIVGERWESPELRLLLYSRFANPLTGTFEYQLTNITRAEPPAALFGVPSDYDPELGGGYYVEFWPRPAKFRAYPSR